MKIKRILPFSQWDVPPRSWKFHTKIKIARLARATASGKLRALKKFFAIKKTQHLFVLLFKRKREIQVRVELIKLSIIFRNWAFKEKHFHSDCTRAKTDLQNKKEILFSIAFFNQNPNCPKSGYIREHQKGNLPENLPQRNTVDEFIKQ